MHLVFIIIKLKNLCFKFGENDIMSVKKTKYRKTIKLFSFSLIKFS